MGKAWRNKYFQYTFSFILAFCFVSLPRWEHEKTDVPSPLLFAGDTLECSIMLDKTLRARGFNIGYLYELFQKFEQDQRCEINIAIADQTPEHQWDALMDGKTDMLLIDYMNELAKDGKMTCKISDGMVTSINDIDNPADFSSCWMLYTSDAENSNTAWGTVEYDGKEYGSAVSGAETLKIKADQLYIWVYQSFS